MASPVLCLIFLVPGAFGTGTSSAFLKSEDYFAEYRAFFEAKGCLVKRAEFPQDATIEERSLVLKDQLARFVAPHPGLRAELVAHSQGGLDARFALKTLSVPGVRSLVTIGTPHRGTPVADWVVDHRERGSFLYWLLRLGGYDLRALSFAGEMREEFLKKHEARFAPVEGVRYGAARGVCKTGCHWALGFLAARAGMTGDNDGIIPGESQRFGEDLGEYDLDHISEVGADAERRAERARWLTRLGAWLGL